MTGVESGPTPGKIHGERSRFRSPRAWGATLAGAIVLESVLGILAADRSDPNLGLLLDAHLAGGAALAAAAASAAFASWPAASPWARAGTAVALGAILSTASVGLVFLRSASPSGAPVDRALALVALLGSLLMVATGGRRVTRDRGPPPGSSPPAELP